MSIYRGDSSESVMGSFAIVVSRYNAAITTKLLDGAISTLRTGGVAEQAIDVAWVPGAFEIPLVADKLAGTNRYAAVLCLGAVIRGDTTHDQHINRAVSLGIMEANLRHGLPVLFGVLTCDTLEQAIQRSSGNVSKMESAGSVKPLVGNKGTECAAAALEMVRLLRSLEQENDKR